MSIEEARKFDQFPLYWLGESYEGLALTYVDVTSDGKHAAFWYGEAKFPGGESDSWTPPLKIEFQPYCGYPPAKFLSYQESLRTHGIDAGTVSDVRVGAADGYLTRYNERNESLYLWSAGSTIYLNTYQIELDVKEAAKALIPIAEPTSATPSPLPPPVTESCIPVTSQPGG